MCVCICVDVMVLIYNNNQYLSCFINEYFACCRDARAYAN